MPNCPFAQFFVAVALLAVAAFVIYYVGVLFTWSWDNIFKPMIHGIVDMFNMTVYNRTSVAILVVISFFILASCSSQRKAWTTGVGPYQAMYEGHPEAKMIPAKTKKYKAERSKQ